ncbi:MAG: molecular chaperone HtpG [Deltaproteobacteria bacterium]|nr:molecular chaperone HtpG [Deltaproteobacteria bacterium]
MAASSAASAAAPPSQAGAAAGRRSAKARHGSGGGGTPGGAGGKGSASGAIRSGPAGSGSCSIGPTTANGSAGTEDADGASCGPRCVAAVAPPQAAPSSGSRSTGASRFMAAYAIPLAREKTMSDDQVKDATQFEFKAQVQQVLDLVINSLYTHSEIFLRELVSNASDALDKARVLRLTREGLAEQQGEPAIEIELDAKARTLTIADNGIGMTREEAIDQLGTIARSGTTDFLKKMEGLGKHEGAESAIDLIGQFGVGFYSAFMVASRVDVQTRSMLPGAEPVLWRSGGKGSFAVLPGEREAPGTRVTVHLKEDADEFCHDWRVEAVVKKYSDFVTYPIRLGGKVINRAAAPWRLPKAQLSLQEHGEFFKHLTGARLGDEPLVTVHYAVDAPVQFHALLYVPPRATPDLFLLGRERPGLRLYARRVLIMESCESLTPGYLRFLRGVVDSEDIPLNVSRETVQEDKAVRQIEAQLTKQVLKALKELSEQDADRYEKFWRAMGPILKEGLATDWKNKDAIAELCRFESLQGGPGKLVGLGDYLAAKPESQKAIYYLTGTDRKGIERSPHLEIFRQRGIDVLLLADPIDEWVASALPEFEKVPLVSVAHGELDLGGEKPAAGETEDKRTDAAVKAIRLALGDRVDEVRPSTRLTDSACCLVSKTGDPGANLDRLMKMLDEKAVEHRRILEVNPNHPLIKNAAALAERDPGSSHLQLWAELLFDQALLAEGVVADPAKLVSRIQDLLVQVSSAVVGGNGDGQAH